MTDLHKNARANEVTALIVAIDSGVDLDRKDQFGSTALMYSISGQNPEATRALIAGGADVTVQDDAGANALHYAAEYGDLDSAKLLLQKQPRLVDVADTNGNQPLWTAVFNANGMYDLVELLLEYGANVEYKNRAGFSPREMAIRFGDVGLVERLD